MQIKLILETMRAAFVSVPLIVQELQNLRKTVADIQNARTDMRLAQIKDDLSRLTKRIENETDKEAFARIISDLNGL